MSKAEVERIWLPFVPWLLLSTALLPERWRRPVLGVQVVVALLVQHLLSPTGDASGAQRVGAERRQPLLAARSRP